MKLKRLLSLAVLCVAGVGSSWADTNLLTTENGWQKITDLGSLNLSDYYFAFVDRDKDLMLSFEEGANQSQNAEYKTMVYRTSQKAEMNPAMLWVIEQSASNAMIRNVGSNLFLQCETDWKNNSQFQPWYCHTNDVTSSNSGGQSWARYKFAYESDSWTIENLKANNKNYIGPWADANFVNGQEVAGNKTASKDIGHFHIYAIERSKVDWIKQASENNPANLSYKIQNANAGFNGKNGWTGTSDKFVRNGGLGFDGIAGFFEPSDWWASSFDITVTQTISNLPAGKYKVRAAGQAETGTTFTMDCGGEVTTLNSIGAAGGNIDQTGATVTPNPETCRQGWQWFESYNKLNSDGDLTIRFHSTASAVNNWANFDNVELYYYGPSVSGKATSTTSPAEVAADTWYAFDVPVAGDYTITPSAGTIYYTQNGELFPSEITTSITEATQLALAKGKLYVKASEAATITFVANTFTYEVGTASTDVDYVQKGQTITVSFANAITTDPNAKFEQHKPITLNGEAVKVNLADKAFTFVMPENTETSTTYTLNIPAEAFGYTGHTMNAAQTITLHTPAIFDGAYYLYNTDNKKYLSRGGNWGTQAMVDEYGIAIVVKTDNENNTELKPFDSYLNLGLDGFMYTDTKDNNIRKFNASKVDGGYKFLNTTNKKYLATYDGQVVGNAVEGGNLQGASNIWTLESVNDHLAVVKTYEDSQAKAAATAASIVVSNKAELENTLKVGNIYPQQIAIKGTQGAVKEDYQHGSSNEQVSKPLDIFAETVNGLRPGLYKLSVNAFQRATLFNDVMNAGGARGKVYVYANDAKTQLKSIAEEYSDEAYTEGNNPNSQSEGKNYPNSMGAANQAFAKNMYVNDVYVYVNADEGADTGTLKFGIQNPTRLGNDGEKGNRQAWTCYNNFTLTYYAQTAEEIVGGVHYYYTSCDAPEFTLTDEVPVVDATNAKITNATIVRKNPNGIVYLAEGSTADNGNNIVVNGTCANLVLTDGHTFTATKNFEATKATYEMTAIAASTDKSFGTIMLPFAINSLPNGAKAYSLENNVVWGEDIHATEVSSIAANTPTIVTAKGTYAANDVAIAATESSYENGQLVGTYKSMEAIENSYVLQKHDDRVAFYLVNNTKPTVKPFRAYIKPQSTNAKQFIKVVFDGEATGIKEITSDNTKAEIFDLSGRRVAKAQKGVYIINGKKVIKK